MSDEQNKQGLGFVELWALGVGQVIGAGIITLIGPAIALTGQSVWLAYFLAVILGAFINLPIIIFSSVTKYSGGNYSIITSLGGEKAGGMYICSFLLQTLGMSLFATALGMYSTSLTTIVSGKAVGIFFLVFFFAVNLMGMSNMAKFQKIMSAILVAALLLFVIVGMTKSDFTNTFAFSDPEFFANGPKGFIQAVLMFSYSCTGYALTVNYGGAAKNPTKDLPRAMLAVVPVLLVLYVGAAIVDSSVLPIDQVVNQPLTIAAKHIFSNGMFLAFIICGPIMALLTTMNSSYAAMVGL